MSLIIRLRMTLG